MRQIGMLFILCLLLTGPFVALAGERSPSEKLQRTTVRLLEYRFEPSQITLKVGEEIELTLVNEGTVMHEFITDALKGLEVDVEINGVVAETLGVAEFEIPPKAKVVLRFTPEKPGEFPIACHAKEPKDHLKEGMSGKLVFR
jgi:plastocyanin